MDIFGPDPRSDCLQSGGLGFEGDFIDKGKFFGYDPDDVFAVESQFNLLEECKRTKTHVDRISFLNAP
jgi:hypothetical protein